MNAIKINSELFSNVINKTHNWTTLGNNKNYNFLIIVR
jgi:hypothetical protein